MIKFCSIIVPIRNEEKHIVRCLTSLVNQGYGAENFEIIVVDGMSSDNTRRLLAPFLQFYRNVRLIDNPERIVPIALNLGIRQAWGEIIVRVDGHAFVESSYLEECVRIMDITGAECVGGVIASINSTTVGKGISLAMSSQFGVGNARFRTAGSAGFVDTLAFGAYRKSVFDQIGYFDESLVRCQDDEFNYRLRKAGGRIYLHPDIKAYYYAREDFAGLWRQYFQYGLWKVRVLQKHLSMMQIRQFVPSLFVITLTATGILSPLYSFPRLLFFSLVVVYFFCALLAGIRLAWKNHFAHFYLLPIAFFTLHFSYGFGFIFGLFRFWGHFRSNSKVEAAGSREAQAISELFLAKTGEP